MAATQKEILARLEGAWISLNLAERYLYAFSPGEQIESYHYLKVAQVNIESASKMCESADSENPSTCFKHGPGIRSLARRIEEISDSIGVLIYSSMPWNTQDLKNSLEGQENALREFISDIGHGR
jgi:hypothetical protein